MRYLTATAGGSPQVTSISKWEKFDQFLILGSETLTYYAGDQQPTMETAGVLRECLAEDGLRAVEVIVQTAQSGRAPRPDPALFALALAASPEHAAAAANAAALGALATVARTAAHLKKFVTFATAQRGWGRGLRSAVARWYLEKPPRELVRQMLKRRDSSRWSHADLLRLSHPKPLSKAQAALFRWAVEGELGKLPEDLRQGDLKLLHAHELAQRASAKREIVGLIEDYQLTSEMVPEQWLDASEVWEALLDTMPYGAMLRHLPRLTSIGVIAPQGESTALVAARLVDRRRIARAKVSPVTLLNTLLNYRHMYSVPAIAAALEEALYIAFDNAQPTGRRIAVALDAAAPIPSAVVGMLIARAEPDPTIRPRISRRDCLDAVLTAIAAHPRGEYIALNADPDLRIVIAANASEPPIPHASDPRLLQIVGFDATVPALVGQALGQPSPLLH
jgi:60 kDa SS-A/Ro ribonucleoprotein